MAKEYGRKEVALIMERMTGRDSEQLVEDFKFEPAAIAEILGEQLLVKQEAAKTDETVALTARVEIRHRGAYNAKICPAETKTVRNPETGEEFEKHYPARVEIHFKPFGKIEDLVNIYVGLGEQSETKL